MGASDSKTFNAWMNAIILELEEFGKNTLGAVFIEIITGMGTATITSSSAHALMASAAANFVSSGAGSKYASLVSMFPALMSGSPSLTDQQLVTDKLMAMQRVCESVTYALDPDRRVIGPLNPDSLIPVNQSFGWLGTLNTQNNWIGRLTTAATNLAALTDIKQAAHITRFEDSETLKLSVSAAAVAVHVTADAGLFSCNAADGALSSLAGETTAARGILCINHENKLVVIPNLGSEAAPTAQDNHELFSLKRPSASIDYAVIRVIIHGTTETDIDGIEFNTGIGPYAVASYRSGS